MRLPEKLSDLLEASVLPHRFLAAQLRRPTGRFGRWIMTRALNRGNAEMIGAVIDALEIGGDDTFLDAGFGGGLALELAARRTRADLWGVDYSADVVVAGQRRLAAMVQAGRLNLVTADVADLPLRAGIIDTACSINTIYFWPDPSAALASLRRVMSDEGRVALGFSGAKKMRELGKVTSHGFAVFEPEEVTELVRSGGFSEVRIIELQGAQSRGDYVALARR